LRKDYSEIRASPGLMAVSVQPRAAGIAGLALQDPEERLGDVRASGPYDDEPVFAGELRSRCVRPLVGDGDR